MDPIEIAAIMNATDAIRQWLGFEQLNDAERVISLISSARFEIIMGGLDGFYYHPAGDYGPETVWAYEQIGAKDAAGIIRQANELFPREMFGMGVAMRSPEWYSILDDAKDQLEALTNRFLALDENLIDDLLANYIVMHRNELPALEI
ncbi:MAG: DMP19 family protein [Chloroflexi bacterium]|nr:DMP19 family protein [Chloroflexota bacterium]